MGAIVKNIICAVCLFVVTAQLGFSATIFSQNFDGLTPGSDISPAGFTENNSTSFGDLQLTGTSLTANISAPSGIFNTNLHAAKVFTNLDQGSTPSFRISTDFVLNSYNNSTSSNFGLALLGNSSDFSTGTQYRVNYSIQTSTLYIWEGSTVIGTSALQLSPTPGMSGSISVIATYIGSSLKLDATLISGSTTLTATTTDTTPNTGTFFGYRNALAPQPTGTGGGPWTMNVTYDNYLVETIPEPGYLLAMSSLSLFVLGWKFRKQKHL